ncbi:hypothetical protein E2553_35095 [Paraburkholderia dipogonis]|uniref:Uncharacterized protein n=1 Tax=Paraburkholderia dipogonis TaxID=1211383 RepID=A0A4Y8MWN0_9BURK|nr:hypothetical protein [Paraburkholderia dipogonis]TFE41869.1 hypothetical protein E2553_35095 [Paraburkholderia dipogonis]
MNNEQIQFFGTSLEQSSGPMLGTASTTQAQVELIAEAELAKLAIPLHLHPSRVLPSHFTEAIERAFVPATRFWFHVDAERFVAALQNQDPAYMGALVLSWEQWGCGSFHEDLINSIRTKQFDEFCALWLASQSQGLASNDDEEVYNLLHSHLRSAGESTHLRYLELDGVKAIRYIREKMESMTV